jgi:hypothetical protein
MSNRDAGSKLWRKIQTDAAYLGGERKSGTAARSSEIKILIVAAVSVSEAVHPLYANITPVAGFSFEAIGT